MKNQTSIGSHEHIVSLHNPGVAVPDGDGGYTQVPAPLDPPTWHCSIVPANVRDLERLGAGTVISTATHILTGDFHPGITTQTTITLSNIYGTHQFSATGVVDPEFQHIETVVIAVEIVQ